MRPSQIGVCEISETFDAFCSQADKVAQWQMIRESAPTMSLRMSILNPDKATIKIPEEKDFLSFLIDIRPFTLHSDVNFAEVNTQVHLRLPAGELQDANARNYDAWIRAMDGNDIFSVCEKGHQAQDLFVLLINGELFNTDPRRAAEFAQIPPIYQESTRLGTYIFAINVGKAATTQATIIRQALSENILDLR